MPARFAAFVADVVEKALQLHESTEDRLKLCNEIIGHLSSSVATAHLDGRHLSGEVKNVLTEVSPAASGTATYPRPATPIWESPLFTGATTDPRLDHELVQENPLCRSDRLSGGFHPLVGLAASEAGFGRCGETGNSSQGDYHVLYGIIEPRELLDFVYR